MEGEDDSPETIDVRELMKDLDEDDSYRTAKQPEAESLSQHSRTSVKPLAEILTVERPDFKEGIRSKTQPTPASTSRHSATMTKTSSDSFTTEPFVVKEVPKWLPPFQSHSSLDRSLAAVPEGSSKDVAAYGKARSSQLMKGSSASRPADLSNVKRAGPTQETLTEHLQKSLSFELSPKEEMKRIFGQKDAINAFYSKELKPGFDAEASTSSSRGTHVQEEPRSAPSIQSSSISKSLWRWFQDDGRKPKQRQDQSKATSKVAGQESQAKQSQHQPSSSLGHSWKLTWPISKISGASPNVRSHVESTPNISSEQKSRSSESGKRRSSQSLTKETQFEDSNQSREVLQQRRPRGLRHSFTLGSWKKNASERKKSKEVNRAMSLELGKAPILPKTGVVLYTTSEKVDAQAFEDSNAARAVLTSMLGTAFEERCVSQDPQYEQELSKALCTETVLVPTVCIRGRYITGLDNIMQMYKKGILKSFMADPIEEEPRAEAPCVCRGGKFLVCPVCKGRRTLIRKEGESEQNVSCHHCSATGLIKCPNCLNT